MSPDDEVQLSRLCLLVSEEDDYWIRALRWIIQNPNWRNVIERKIETSVTFCNTPWAGTVFEIENNLAVIKDVRDEIKNMYLRLMQLNHNVESSGRAALESAKDLASLHQQRQNLHKAYTLLERLILDVESYSNFPAA